MPAEHPHSAIDRRQLLAGISVLVLAPVPVACAQERPPARAPGRLIAGDTCPLTPRQTEGPFYFDSALVRRDIKEGRAGVPLRLRLQIVGAADCAPAAGARVDIWHCDAGGAYSGYDRQRGSGETFLRGTQFAGTDGVAAFDTLYPGWYEGRAPHVHCKIWLPGGTELTSQIYFPDALSDRLYRDGPYAGRGERRMRNADDGIFRSLDGRAPLAAMSSTAAGYDGAIVIALS